MHAQMPSIRQTLQQQIETYKAKGITGKADRYADIEAELLHQRRRHAPHISASRNIKADIAALRKTEDAIKVSLQCMSEGYHAVAQHALNRCICTRCWLLKTALAYEAKLNSVPLQAKTTAEENKLHDMQDTQRRRQIQADGAVRVGFMHMP